MALACLGVNFQIFAAFNLIKAGMETIQQGIRPEKAIEILKRNGIAINAEEAEAILEFLYLLAAIFINDMVDA